MTATAVNPITQPYPTTAYLTVDEYVAAPTSVDLDDLVDGGDTDTQTAMLATTIARASSMADIYCQQILSATVDVETGWCRWQPGRGLRVTARYKPVIEVQTFSVAPNGWDPATRQPISDPSRLIFDSPSVFTVPFAAGLPFSSNAPFGSVAFAPNSRWYCQWSYVNGYANTTLAADVAADDTTIVVVDATGIYPGHPLRIYDPLNATDEPLTVTAVNGTTLTVAPLASQHSAGVSVSALPPAVKQAIVLLTNALIATRGDDAIVMNELTTPGTFKEFTSGSDAQIDLAYELLDPFRVSGAT